SVQSQIADGRICVMGKRPTDPRLGLLGKLWKRTLSFAVQAIPPGGRAMHNVNCPGCNTKVSVTPQEFWGTAICPSCGCGFAPLSGKIAAVAASISRPPIQRAKMDFAPEPVQKLGPNVKPPPEVIVTEPVDAPILQRGQESRGSAFRAWLKDLSEPLLVAMRHRISYFRERIVPPPIRRAQMGSL